MEKNVSSPMDTHVNMLFVNILPGCVLFFSLSKISILTHKLLLSTDVKQSLFHLNPSPVLSPLLIFLSPSQH